jgi:hypothetical protein
MPGGSEWIFVGEQDVTPLTDKITFYHHFVAPHARWRMQTNNRGEYLTIRNWTPYFINNPEIWR